VTDEKEQVVVVSLRLYTLTELTDGGAIAFLVQYMIAPYITDYILDLFIYILIR
jgi:hypothetical protein